METKRQKRNNLAIATGVFGGVTILLFIMMVVAHIQLKAQIKEKKKELASHDKVIEDVASNIQDVASLIDESKKLLAESERIRARISAENSK